MSRKVWVMIPVVIFFTWIGVAVMDPDYGWHYRLGELIMEKGFPKTDPFSYTMPSYPFVDYEWGTNVLIYVAEKYAGRGVTAILFSLAAVASFWLAIPKKGQKYWWWVMWLGLSVAITRFAVRPQVFSWLFTAVVVRLITDETVKKKWQWGFVPLMWIWANLHGSYFVGLGLWGLWWGVRTLRERRIYRNELIIGFTGLLITLLNPYGIRNWQEILIQMGLTNFYAVTLEEWQPFWKKVDFGFLAMGVWLVGMGWRYKLKIKIEDYAVVLTGMVAGMTSLRHGVLAMVIAGPVAVKLWTEMEAELGGVKKFSQRWKVFRDWAWGVAVVILVMECGLLLKYKVGYSTKEYPEAAVKYLQEKGYGQRLLVSYEWSGYLVWRISGEKVFVDGRMPGWRWRGEVPEGESRQAFKEYLEIDNLPRKYAETVLSGYDIRTVMWRKRPGLSGGLADWLSDRGWQKKYDDNLAVIFEYE